jgi:hypothetical protein
MKKAKNLEEVKIYTTPRAEIKSFYISLVDVKFGGITQTIQTYKDKVQLNLNFMLSCAHFMLILCSK